MLNDDTDENEPHPIEKSKYYNDDNFISMMSNKTNPFTVLSMNIQSINAKFDELKIYIEILKKNGISYNAICIQESWLRNDTNTTLYDLEGYNLISKGSRVTSHGGLAIYLKQEYTYEFVDLNIESDIWENVFIKINDEKIKRKIILGNVYRPPVNINENFQQFINEFTNVLDTLHNINGEIIIAGDYNMDLLLIKDKPIFSEYIDTVFSLGYVPKITVPTRFSKYRGTLIDNFICKLSANYIQTTSGVLLENISDHQPYFICLENIIKNNSMTHSSKPVFDFKCVEQLKRDLENKDILNQINNDITHDPNESYDTLHKILEDTISSYIKTKPKKFNKHKHKKSHWITNGIIRSIKFRDRLYLRLKRTQPDTQEYERLKINLKTYNRILKNNIQQAKLIYYNTLFERYKYDIKNTWATINDIINKKPKNKVLPASFIINGENVTDKRSIANNFNTFFTNIGPNLARLIDNTNVEPFSDYLATPTDHRFQFTPVNSDIIEKTINKLATKTSTGFDNLSTKLLKSINSVLSPIITLIFNQSITTGIFPSKLKIAKVTPIFKKGTNNLLDNYRPISILPAISKVFEKIMFQQLHTYFQSNNLYFNSQYGFREQHSTELATIEFIDQVTLSLDKGEIPISIYLDLSKAFDTIDHKILTHKLKYYGIQGTTLKLCIDYLTNRKQYVEIDGFTSDKATITTGVPQGSVLGPLLFLIYINDFQQASTLFKMITYADDTTLLYSLNTSLSHTYNYVDTLNLELNNIIKWLNANKLSLNISKTKFMVFSMPQKHVNIPDLQINGTSIESVDTFNFLGITIDKHLTWQAHTNKIANKISKTIGVIRKLQTFVPQNILIMIYNSLILSHLNYGILCWGYQNKRLSILQKQALRAITSSNFNAHTEPLFKNLNLLKLSDIHTLFELKFYYRYINKTLPAYFHKNFLMTNLEIHQYHTRNIYKFHIPKHKHEFCKKTLRYSMVKTINNSSENILSKVYTHSPQGFSHYFKLYIIGLYKKECIIPNCYICLYSSNHNLETQ